MAALLWALKAEAAERRQQEKVRACRLRAEQGNASAEVDLGSFYYYGRGVPQDYSLALNWYRKAADQGDATAEYSLASMYYYGIGLPLDLSEASRWYFKAADQGHEKAESMIGFMYLHGHGLPTDYDLALTWFHKSADKGDSFAQDEIGRMYYHGQGVSQDSAEAVRWYRKAADQGYASAQSAMGFMTYYGYGVAKSRVDSNRWFRKAADQGDSYAMRAISCKLSTLAKVSLGARLIVGIWLSLSFLSLNSFEHSVKPWSVRQTIKSAAGMLLIFTAGQGWYGYTHYKIRPVSNGLNVFTCSYWLLGGVTLILFYCLAHSSKTPGEDNRGEDSGSVDDGKASRTLEC